MKNKMDYVLAEDRIPMNAEYTLEQLTAHFRSVDDGLPELIKNSKDQYSRVGINQKKDRQIVIIVSEDMQRLGVLDFGGAKLTDFGGWKEWSSRTAGRSEVSMDIEAGKGNGGKAFMARGITINASMCGYSDGKLTKMGFSVDNPNSIYIPVFFKNEDGKIQRDINESNPRDALDRELDSFGISTLDLPEEALKIFEKRKAFTFVQLNGVRDWSNYNNTKLKRIITQIEKRLQDHPQAALTIETCIVWIQFVSLSSLVGPLSVPDLEPYEGLEDIASIQIPDTLVDPLMEEEVSTESDGHKKFLKLRVTKKNLRISDNFKARNVIRVRNLRNVVSNWSVADLAPISTSSFIYGEIICPALTEEYQSSSERQTLVNTPLVRALKHWAGEQVLQIATQIQRLQAEKTKDENEDSASQTLRKLRELMIKYLHREESEEVTGPKGTDQGGISPKPPTPPSRYGEKIDKIEVESPNANYIIAEGSTIPLNIKCYETTENGALPVASPKLRIRTEISDVVHLVSNYSIKGLKHGRTKVWFETKDGLVKSEPISISVIKVSKLTIDRPKDVLKQGQRIKLDVLVYDNSNLPIKSDNFLYETYVDEADMGKLTKFGNFTAGGEAGEVTVRIAWGSEENQVSTCMIEVGTERIERNKGSVNLEMPHILLCGTEAPGKDDLPKEQRTHIGGEDYPTIIDFDPLWENVVWLNHHSHESTKVRTTGIRGGNSLKLTSKTFQQFLTLKCFEILKRLKVRSQFSEMRPSSSEFFNALGEAEIEASGFIEKAYDLVDQIIEGEYED